MIIQTPGLWDRVQSKTWARDVFVALGGMIFLMQGLDSTINVIDWAQQIHVAERPQRAIER
jgi:hypothetical protein